MDNITGKETAVIHISGYFTYLAMVWSHFSQISEGPVAYTLSLIHMYRVWAVVSSGNECTYSFPDFESLYSPGTRLVVQNHRSGFSVFHFLFYLHPHLVDNQ